MKTQRRNRLIIIIFSLIILSSSVALVLYSLGDNLNLFYSPSDVQAGNAPVHKNIRVGGMVLAGSLKQEKSSLKGQFIVTDYEQEVIIHYDQILPNLFTEGKGVVAVGQLDETGQFNAKTIMAKHDENYMSPEVAEILKKQEEQGK